MRVLLRRTRIDENREMATLLLDDGVTLKPVAAHIGSTWSELIPKIIRSFNKNKLFNDCR